MDAVDRWVKLENAYIACVKSYLPTWLWDDIQQIVDSLGSATEAPTPADTGCYCSKLWFVAESIIIFTKPLSPSTFRHFRDRLVTTIKQ